MPVKTSSDDNNNKSLSAINKIKKFSRDELLKVKHSMVSLNSTAKNNVLPSIYQEDNTLDKTLDRQKNRSSVSRSGDAVDKMMPPYTQRNSYQKQRSVDHTSSKFQFSFDLESLPYMLLFPFFNTDYLRFRSTITTRKPRQFITKSDTKKADDK